MNLNPESYEFSTLCTDGVTKSMGCLIGKVDASDPGIYHGEAAGDMIALFYDVEDVALEPADLRALEERYYASSFQPLTPVMVTREWSPIGHLLKAGAKPVFVEKEGTAYAVAMGLWGRGEIRRVVNQSCEKTSCDDEIFFMDVLRKVVEVMRDEGEYVCVVSGVGWSSKSARDSLIEWDEEEIRESGRLIWRRTPQCGLSEER